MKNIPSELTILIVDHDTTRRRQLKESLTTTDYLTCTFLETTCTVDVSALLQTFAIQAIILPERLPNEDVPAWLSSVRKTRDRWDIPVFILVETEDQTTIARFLQAGASFCFSLASISPFLLPQVLLAALTTCENQSELRPQNTLNIQLEERLRLAFETAKMGYWEWNLQTNRVQWRYQAEEIFGLRDEQFDGTMNGVLALIHPEDRDVVERTLQNSIATGEDYKVEFRVQNDAQSVRWLIGQGRTFFDTTNQPSLMIGVLRDVTERITASLSLSASQQLNQAILDSIPEHIAVLDQTGNIVAINRAWREFALQNGLSSNALGGTIGTNYLEVCEAATGDCSEDAAAVCDGIKAVLNGTIDHFRLEYPCHSPVEERWFLLQVTPLLHVGGGVVVSHLNITERRVIEARLSASLAEAELAKESAEEANCAKNEFIAQVTHDLRSPLSAVLGWAKVLKNKKTNEQLKAEAVETIIKSAEKQRNLIEDLLDVSRMTTGKLRLDITPVSLSKVIRSAMDVMKPACEAKGIECTTELATDADAVTGDPARLEQVIWNLVSNAVKFTPNKGQIKVRLERADPYVRILVSDTGCGIKEEHLPFVFDRYWQSATSGGRRKGGLGLGLSLVKYIIELHGGTVAVESEGENKGTTFTINLPYRAVRLQSETAMQSDEKDMTEDDVSDLFLNSVLSSPVLEELMVVVVDDELSARELVAEILRQHGAIVQTADSAAMAFDIIASSEKVPDLLVSDISMPDEDGYTLIRKIRNLPPDKGGAIPAVALTAFGRMEDRVRALSAGFQMHLPKPVEPAELALVVANLTNREITAFMQT